MGSLSGMGLWGLGESLRLFRISGHRDGRESAR